MSRAFDVRLLVIEVQYPENYYRLNGCALVHSRGSGTSQVHGPAVNSGHKVFSVSAQVNQDDRH